MVWRTLKEVVPLLDESFRKTYYKFKEKIQGPSTEKPRRKTCFSYTDNILGPILGSLFVRKAFSPESKAKVSASQYYNAWCNVATMLSIVRARAEGKIFRFGKF